MPAFSKQKTHSPECIISSCCLVWYGMVWYVSAKKKSATSLSVFFALAFVVVVVVPDKTRHYRQHCVDPQHCAVALLLLLSFVVYRHHHHHHLCDNDRNSYSTNRNNYHDPYPFVVIVIIALEVCLRNSYCWVAEMIIASWTWTYSRKGYQWGHCVISSRIVCFAIVQSQREWVHKNDYSINWGTPNLTTIPTPRVLLQ